MKCKINRCRQDSNILYYGFPVCNLHWIKHCDYLNPFDLKKELGIKESLSLNTISLHAYKVPYESLTSLGKTKVKELKKLIEG